MAGYFKTNPDGTQTWVEDTETTPEIPVVAGEIPGFIFDYTKNEFVPATTGQINQREQFYQEFPEIAPPGTPDKVTPAEYDKNKADAYKQRVAEGRQRAAEIRRQEDEMSPLIQRIYPERFGEGNRNTAWTSKIFRDTLVWIETDSVGFLRDLMGRSTPQDTEAFLKALGAPPDVIGPILANYQNQQGVDQLVNQVFPGLNTEGLDNLIETNPEQFVQQMITGGLTPAKQNLLQVMGYSPEDITNIFTPQVNPAIDNAISYIDQMFAEKGKFEFFNKDKSAVARAMAQLGIESVQKTDEGWKVYPPDQQWQRLTPEQKQQVAQIYADDPNKSNAFASFVAGVSQVSSQNTLVGFASSPFLASATPIAKKLTGQDVTPMEWAVGAANLVLLGLGPAGGAVSALGRGGAVAVKATTAAGFGIFTADTVMKWPEMGTEDKVIAVAMNTLFGLGVLHSFKGTPVKASDISKNVDAIVSKIDDAKKVEAKTALLDITKGIASKDETLIKQSGERLQKIKGLEEQGKLVSDNAKKLIETGKATPEAITNLEKATVENAKLLDEKKISALDAKMAEVNKQVTEIPKTEVKPVEPVVEVKPIPETPIEPEFAGNIRLEKYSEEVRPLIKEWADTHPEEVQKARRGVIPDEQVRKEAEKLTAEVGGDLDKLRKRWKPGQAWNAEELLAIRGVLKQKTNEVIEIQKIVKGDNSAQNLLKLQVALKEQAAVQEMVHGVTAEAGRALRSFRQEAIDAIRSNDTERMEALLKKIGGREYTEKVAKLLGQLDIKDPVAVNKFVQSLYKPHAMDYITELFYNSILSGPKTHIVNSLSNIANALLSPAERMGSALIEKPLSKIQGRPQERFLSEVPADIFGAAQGIPEGFRQFAYVIKNGISLEQATKWEFRPRAFKGKKGAVIGLPSRFLEAADAMMKTVNQRAALNAEAHRMASKQGLKGKAFESMVADLLSNPPEEMLSEANRIAEYRLFRQEPGKFGAWLMSGREKLDVAGFQPLRFVVPFLRTPMNLVKFGLERTPLGYINAISKLSAKDPEAADALARATIGSLGMAALAWYVGTGKITGAPPRDRAERDRFYREGKQPYAIRVGDFWVSYQRLEPFNQLLSQVSILTDMIANNDKGIDEKIADAAFTFSQNFVSQSYMSSVSDLMNMLAEPERYAGNWINRFATAMGTPMSSASRTVAQMLDNVVRDPSNMLETFEANIPGLSTRAQAKLSVLGEEIIRKSPAWFPVNVTPVEETILSQEIERLKYDIGFAGTSIAGMKLSDDEQRDYQILSGQLIKKDLEKLMLAPDYWQASDADRTKMISKVVDAARDWAKVKMQEKLWTTGQTEDRISVLETALNQSDSRLGNVISETPEFTHEPPNIYDLSGELDTSYRALLHNIPESSLKGIKTPPTVTSWYAKERARSKSSSIPDKSLVDINTDPAKGTTFEDYRQQWQRRSTITDQRELEIFDDKFPDAKLGNISRRQLELLQEYNKFDKAGREKFLKGLSPDENKMLTASGYTEWLKANPKDNAQLAIWGEAKILTKEAYAEYKNLVKGLDIVNSALPKLTLPPETSIETHFKYEQAVLDNKGSSWETQLLLRKDAEAAKKAGVQSYADWKGLKLSDTPMASLELKVKNRDNFDKLDGFSNDKSSSYIADEKARAEAITKFKTTNPQFVDDMRRIEAIEAGNDENPTNPKLIDAHVKFGQLIDQPDRGSSSAEAMLFRVDNPEYDKFRIDETIWGDQALKPVDQTKIPIWRIDAKYRKEDAEYQTILDIYEGREESQQARAYLANDEAYRKDRRRREAYGLSNSATGYKLPVGQVDNYVNFNELERKGKRQERFIVENPDFAQEMFTVTGKDIYKTRPEDVPNVAYDDIYDKYKDNFDKLDGFADFKSPNYIEDTTKREAARNALRFTNGKLNEFGLAEIERDAYAKFVPEKYTDPAAKGNPVKDYVGYYKIIGEGKPANWEAKTGTDKWFEDDWYMMEHQDFYKNVYLGILGNERKDYRKVPTREVFGKYLTYLQLGSPTSKKNYREANPELDAWGVLALDWKAISEQKRRTELSSTDRALEDVNTQRLDWQAQIDEIYNILAGVQ